MTDHTTADPTEPITTDLPTTITLTNTIHADRMVEECDTPLPDSLTVNPDATARVTVDTDQYDARLVHDPDSADEQLTLVYNHADGKHTLVCTPNGRIIAAWPTHSEYVTPPDDPHEPTTTHY